MAAGKSGATITTGIACDCTPPFFVGIVTDATQDTAAVTTAGNNRGNQFMGLLTCSILTSIEPILEKYVHLQV